VKENNHDLASDSVIAWKIDAYRSVRTLEIGIESARGSKSDAYSIAPVSDSATLI